MRRYALVAALAAAFAVNAHEGPHGDIDKVNRSIHVEAGEQYRDVSTVNGSITIDDGARVDSAETVNGSIRLGARAIAGALDTVNGSVTLRDSAIVKGDVETVNGRIGLEAGADVGGHVANVNGEIELERAHVGGDIETVNGDVEVGGGSRVEGGIRVEKPTGSWFNWSSTQSRPPRVVIGPGAVVEGELVFEREVELYVHESAKIGRVTGAEAKRYGGDRPTF
jgi:cytoskeletal protein CcmA (bactofilin family)